MAERFHVELAALPVERFAGIPAAKRLAQVLKIALRRAGLKAVSVRRVGHSAAPTPADTSKPEPQQTAETAPGRNT